MISSSNNDRQAALSVLPRQRPDLAVILGSGLGAATECCHLLAEIPYSDIPGFPASSVAGHAGSLIVAECSGWNIWFFSGRFHLYEGYTVAEVVAPVDLAAVAGATRVLLTNAAGVINDNFPVRSFMCISDQINMTGNNPLIGVRTKPFVDLSRIYNQELYSRLIAQQENHGVVLNQGVLLSVLGPSYETPAEIRAFKALGADVVSMSTVPEAIMARYHGMDVAGLSFLSNRAAGCTDSRLDHSDVLSAGAIGADQLCNLLPVLIQEWQSL